MKEYLLKAIGFAILFFTLIFTLQLFLLLKLEILLFLLFASLVLFRGVYKKLLSKEALSFFIDNIVIATWIIASIELILMSTEFDYTLYNMINISIFILLSYLIQFIMKRKYISENDISTQVKLDRFNFTEREKELIQYLIKGFKYKEIAVELFISENTVKKHISNIYSKASVKNKIELIYKITQH